jgi:hypothetical protein
MDEYERGMDSEVKKYFRKILNSFSYTMMWLMAVVTAGLFFRLAIVDDTLHWYHVVFYALALLSLAALIRFLYRLWNKD